MEENTTQAQQGASQGQQPAVPQNPPVAAPMPTQASPSTLPEQPILQGHSHKALYAALALSLGAAVILLIAIVGMMTKHPALDSIKTQTIQYPQDQTAHAQGADSVQTQVQQVTPQPINSKQNLDSAAQTLDTTDTTQISNGLDQNTQDSSAFGQ